MNDMKRDSDCCPSCFVTPPAPCTADCSLQRTPARKRAAPAPAAQPPSIGYVNVKHGTFHTLAQLAATERNGDLIASGEIVEVCPVARGAAPASPASAPTAPTDISKRLRTMASSAFTEPYRVIDKLMNDAADEIERYYGGMMAWKKTAEKKDKDWNDERMARINDRCAERAAAPVAHDQAQSVSEGWLLVPKHPEQSMINAFIAEYHRKGGSESGCYRALLAAAPLPPAATPAPELTDDKRDAERYRWLRDKKANVSLVIDKQTDWVPPDESVPGVGGYWMYEYRAGAELDTAIDAAIQAQGSDAA